MKKYKMKLVAVALASTMVVGCSEVVSEVASNLTATTDSEGNVSISVIPEEIKALITKVEYGTSNMESYQYKLSVTADNGAKRSLKGLVDLKNNKAEYEEDTTYFDKTKASIHKVFDMNTSTVYEKKMGNGLLVIQRHQHFTMKSLHFMIVQLVLFHLVKL